MDDHQLTDLRRRYPLPDGIEDTVVNRAQLAIALGVSDNTISKYITQPENPMPVLTAGGNGKEYEFRLADCHAWRLARDDAARAQKDAGDRAAAQLALAFRNQDEDDAQDGVALTPKQIIEESEADYKRNRAAELRGELVRAWRVRELFEDMLVEFRTAIVTVVDYSEMEFALTPDQVDRLEKRCDSILVQARVNLTKAIGSRDDTVIALAERDDAQEQLPV